MQDLVFKTSQDFTQAAFNRVAELVSQHGEPYRVYRRLFYLS